MKERLALDIKLQVMADKLFIFEGTSFVTSLRHPSSLRHGRGLCDLQPAARRDDAAQRNATLMSRADLQGTM